MSKEVNFPIRVNKARTDLLVKGIVRSTSNTRNSSKTKTKLNSNKAKLKPVQIQPIKLINLNQLLYKKYCSDIDLYNKNMINSLIRNKNCRFVANFKNRLIVDFNDEFLKRLYNMEEANERLMQMFNYYKNYQMFFCNPTYCDLKINRVLQTNGENRAELFYKNKYGPDQLNLDRSDYKSTPNKNLKAATTFFNTTIKCGIDEVTGNCTEKTTNISLEKYYCNTAPNNNNDSLDLLMESQLFNDSTLYTNRAKDSSIHYIINTLQNKTNSTEYKPHLKTNILNEVNKKGYVQLYNSNKLAINSPTSSKLQNNRFKLSNTPTNLYNSNNNAKNIFSKFSNLKIKKSEENKQNILTNNFTNNTNSNTNSNLNSNLNSNIISNTNSSKPSKAKFKPITATNKSSNDMNFSNFNQLNTKTEDFIKVNTNNIKAELKKSQNPTSRNHGFKSPSNRLVDAKRLMSTNSFYNKSRAENLTVTRTVIKPEQFAATIKLNNNSKTASKEKNLASGICKYNNYAKIIQKETSNNQNNKSGLNKIKKISNRTVSDNFYLTQNNLSSSVNRIKPIIPKLTLRNNASETAFKYINTTEETLQINNICRTEPNESEQTVQKQGLRASVEKNLAKFNKIIKNNLQKPSSTSTQAKSIQKLFAVYSPKAIQKGAKIIFK